MHDVAVLHGVVLALNCQTAGCAALRLGAVLDEIIVLDDLGPDKAFLKIGMYDSRRGPQAPLP